MYQERFSIIAKVATQPFAAVDSGCATEGVHRFA
jgi:hypothetical protein